jgi:hypothetical protein
LRERPFGGITVALYAAKVPMTDRRFVLLRRSAGRRWQAADLAFFVNLAIDEVAFLVEVIVDAGVD